jgi:putative ABC transport system substrate-binding protein
MRRRELIALLGGAATFRPLAAKAQQAVKPARIGYLSANPKDSAVIRAFIEELDRLGYAENRNLELMTYNYGLNPDGLAEKVTEFVAAKPDLIVADGPETPLKAVRAASDAVPVIIVAVNYDPIARGYAASIARPGGNVTGVFFRSAEVAGKQLELLKEMVPSSAAVSVLWAAEVQDEFDAVQTAAKTLGLKLDALKLGDPPYDLEAIFQKLAESEPRMVLVLSPPYFVPHRGEIAALALRYRMPAMFRFRVWAELGGLMSFGVDSNAMRRRAARYVAKMLNGAKPAELPIERADKFELVINLKTARALGLNAPQSLLARADEVIE